LPSISSFSLEYIPIRSHYMLFFTRGSRSFRSCKIQFICWCRSSLSSRSL